MFALSRSSIHRWHGVKFVPTATTRRTRNDSERTAHLRHVCLCNLPPAALIDTIGKAYGDWIDLGLKTAAWRVIMRDA